FRTIDTANQRQVELHDVRLQIDDAFEVRVAGSEVVDYQVGARARADLLEHVDAQVIVRERRGFGDLQVHVLVVKEQWVVRTHEPVLTQLMRVEIDEKRSILDLLESYLAHRTSQLATAILVRSAFEQ